MNTHYDVIIIGSGAGGGTLARHLAPSGKSILILEPVQNLRFCRFSGSFEPIFDFKLPGLYQLVYYPGNLNRKAAKIIPKIDEPLDFEQVLRARRLAQEGNRKLVCRIGICR